MARGVVYGPAFVVNASISHLQEIPVEASALPAEIARFHAGLDTTRAQLESIRDEVRKRSGEGEAGVLDAHLMVLADEAFHQEVLRSLEQRQCNVEVVVRDEIRRYVETLLAMKDGYLRERALDIQDVAKRLIRNLCGVVDAIPSRFETPHVLVAEDLSPSETASLSPESILGFATDMGSPTSHTALLAGSLEIPAVVALRTLSEQVHTGDMLLMDGIRGVVIVRPGAEELAYYKSLAELRHGIEVGLDNLQDEPAETLDGHRVRLLANIEDGSELDAVLQHGAEGIGLFRTEYLWMTGDRDVSEEHQTEVYSRVARRMEGRPTIIRTLDLGGDKLLDGSTLRREANPFLGVRAIRYLLRHPEVFRAQLRALLRASAHGDVKIMYPMISDVSEVIAANEHLEACRKELRAAGTPFNEQIHVGVMIEIPSAALTARILAEHVSFFCLGTNDLVQYTLAVDRINENVADLYVPTHPAVLRLLEHSVEAGHEAGLWVGICGEMAADPILVPLLLGLGFDELSVAPGAVPLVKDAVRQLTMSQARELAAEVATLTSGAAVRARCEALMQEVAPELVKLVS